MATNNTGTTAQFGEVGTNGKPRPVLFFALEEEGTIHAMVLNDAGEITPAEKLENYLGLSTK